MSFIFFKSISKQSKQFKNTFSNFSVFLLTIVLVSFQISICYLPYKGSLFASTLTSDSKSRKHLPAHWLHLMIPPPNRQCNGDCTHVKDGILRWFGFRVRILWDLASTYVLCRPCSSSLYFGISRSSGWSDLVVNEERNLS